MQITRISSASVFFLASVAFFVLGACSFDPVHEDAVAALGASEGPYPAEGEFHRRGQPCLTCHGGKGPASSEFLLGGTVFMGTCNDPSNKAECDRSPAGNTYVRIRSANNGVRCLVTNAAGNFFVRKGEWDDFQFPYLVSIQRDGKAPRVMGSHSSRWGSCASCHKSDAYSDSAGQVSLLSSNALIPPNSKAVWPLPVNYKQETSCVAQ